MQMYGSGTRRHDTVLEVKTSMDSLAVQPDAVVTTHD